MLYLVLPPVVSLSAKSSSISINFQFNATGITVHQYCVHIHAVSNEQPLYTNPVIGTICQRNDSLMVTGLQELITYSVFGYILTNQGDRHNTSTAVQIKTLTSGKKEVAEGIANRVWDVRGATYGFVFHRTFALWPLVIMYFDPFEWNSCQTLQAQNLPGKRRPVLQGTQGAQGTQNEIKFCVANLSTWLQKVGYPTWLQPETSIASNTT